MIAILNHKICIRTANNEQFRNCNRYKSLFRPRIYDYMLTHTCSNLPYLESKTNRFFLHIEDQGHLPPV